MLAAAGGHMHKSSEFRGIVFTVRVKGECPIYMLHKKLFGFFQEATQALESCLHLCYKHILLSKSWTSRPGNIKLISVLYCVIIYKFHSVATFDLCREKLALNPWIRLYLAPACLTTNKDNL